MTHLKLRSRLSRSTAAVLLAVVVGSCAQPLSIEDVVVRPTSFAAVGSTTFSATVGTAVTNQGQVRVLDQDGVEMPGMTVVFTASGGTLSPTSPVQTNSQGIAAPASWTVPTTAGPATLTATLQGASLGNVTFNATLNAGPASAATVNAGNDQTSPAGTAVATAPSVKVSDQYGNGISGVSVAFTVLTGGGTLNGSTATTANATTNSSGIASVTSWTLGQTVGSNTLRAVATGLTSSPVTFTATGAAGPVASIVIAPGTPSSQGQAARAGTNVTVAPAVLVRDQFNNPVAGATVNFTISAGAGKVFFNATDATGSNALDFVSNASGIATVFGWKLGSVGTNTITVTVPGVTGLPSFAINAIGEAGPPSQIAIVVEDPSSNNQSAQVDSAVAVGPAVVVRDADNFIAPNVQVTFTVGASSGTIKGTSTSTASTSATITTDASGIARLHAWNLGQRGANTLTAAVTVNTTLNVTFDATGIAGPPASAAVLVEDPSSNNQTTIANTEVPVMPAVLVLDANGDPVEAGHDVEFTLATGGGSVSATVGGAPVGSATVQTDANGVARLGYWKPGTVGTNTLSAEVLDTPSPVFVNFTATGTLGPASQISYSNEPWPYTRQSTPNGGVPKAIVKDEGGNVLGGVNVVWSNNGNGNSTLGGTTTTPTNGSGVATFTGTWTAAGVASGTVMQLAATVQGTAIVAIFPSTIVGPPNSTLTTAPSQMTVNLVVTPSPNGSVRDASNRPIPGAALTWTYTTNPGGFGTLFEGGSPPAATDSVGNWVLSTWRISTTAGLNTVNYNVTGTGITPPLNTTGVAGAPASMLKSAGDGQTAPAGTAVPVAPAVTVRDQFNNPVNGVEVTFSPATGSGSVTGNPPTTNLSGVATVGSWTLGPAAGNHTLTASLTGTSSVFTTFTATATSSDPCVNPTAHTVGTSVNGTLASTDCNFTSASVTRYMDLYQIVVPTGTTRQMSVNLNVGSFGPQLRHYIYPPSNANWFNTSSTPANIDNFLVLGPGTYEIGATSDAATTTGSYTFLSTLNPAMPSHCGNFLVTKNITVTHTLSSTTCLYTQQGSSSITRGSRVYLFYLPANQTATFRVAGSTIDWVIDAWDVSGTRTAIDQADSFGSGGTETLTIASSTSSRFIEVRVTQWDAQAAASGTYTLTIDP